MGATYVFVVDALQKHQLPVGPLGVGLVLEGPAQLLHCHREAQDRVERRAFRRVERDLQISYELRDADWFIENNQQLLPDGLIQSVRQYRLRSQPWTGRRRRLEGTYTGWQEQQAGTPGSSPNDALGTGTDGPQLLVAPQHGECGVAHLYAVELALCLTHGATSWQSDYTCRESQSGWGSHDSRPPPTYPTSRVFVDAHH